MLSACYLPHVASCTVFLTPCSGYCCCRSGQLAEAAGGAGEESCRSGPQRAGSTEQSRDRSLKTNPQEKCAMCERKTRVENDILTQWP